MAFDMKTQVLHLNRVLDAWPSPEEQLAVVRVSPADFAQLTAAARLDARRPTFMGAPVECAPDLPLGFAVLGFESGEVRAVRVEWSKLRS
jgi:hypothetical protein